MSSGQLSIVNWFKPHLRHFVFLQFIGSQNSPIFSWIKSQLQWGRTTLYTNSMIHTCFDKTVHGVYTPAFHFVPSIFGPRTLGPLNLGQLQLDTSHFGQSYLGLWYFGPSLLDQISIWPISLCQIAIGPFSLWPISLWTLTFGLLSFWTRYHFGPSHLGQLLLGPFCLANLTLASLFWTKSHFNPSHFGQRNFQQGVFWVQGLLGPKRDAGFFTVAGGLFSALYVLDATLWDFKVACGGLREKLKWWDQVYTNAVAIIQNFCCWSCPCSQLIAD